MPTYTRSRDFALSSYVESRRKDIFCSVLVSVVLCLAAWASPVAHVEGKTLDDVAASGACFAARVESIYLYEFSTIPGALVREEGQKHVPSGVRDNSGEAVVADHPGDVQILDYDHLVLANESSGKLVHLVAATVGHLGVETSELDASFVPVAASFLFAGKRTGEAPLALHLSGVVPKVGDLLAGGERGQGGDTEVDTHGGLELGQVLDGAVLAEQGHVPALGGVKAHRGAGRLRTFRQRPAPSDVERGVHLGQGQLALGEAESATGEFRRTTRAFLFEAGVLGSLDEEISVGGLQVAQGLLDRDARNLVQERKLWLFLPASERGALSRVPYGLLTTGPRFGALVQGAIVDEAAAPYRPAKQDLLLGGRVEAVLESSQRHACRIASTPVKSTVVATGQRFLCQLKQAVSARETQ